MTGQQLHQDALLSKLANNNDKVKFTSMTMRMNEQYRNEFQQYSTHFEGFL